MEAAYELYEEDGTRFDLADFFYREYDELVGDGDALACSYFAKRLEDDQAKARAAVRRFGIEGEDADEVSFVLDTTVFGTCKKGLAVTPSGIYLVDEAGKRAFLDWDDFAACKVSRVNDTLTIAGHPFIMSRDEARLVARVMRDLRK